MIMIMMMGWPKSKKGDQEDQGLGGFPVPPVVVHRCSLLQLQDHNLEIDLIKLNEKLDKI